MNGKKIFILALLIICKRAALSTDNLKLIFFTNFNYFKQNERNFKKYIQVDSAVSSSNGVFIPGLTPVEPGGLMPNVNPTDSIPNGPSGATNPGINNPAVPTPGTTTSPSTPGIPSKPDESRFTEIFFNNAWIYDTYFADSPKSLLVSPSQNLYIGMGAIKTGFTIENTENVTLSGGTSSDPLVGMLSVDGGGIINGSQGTITVDSPGTNIAMKVLGSGTVVNAGNIILEASQIGMYGNAGSTLENSGKITSNGGTASSVDGTGTFTNMETGIIDVSQSGTGSSSSNGGTSLNKGTINVGDGSIGMYAADGGILKNSGSIVVSSGGTGVYINDTQGTSQFENLSGSQMTIDGGTGIYLHGTGTFDNQGTLTVTNSGIGIFTDTSRSATNSSELQLTNSSGMVSTEKAAIPNSGTISSTGSSGRGTA